MIEHYDPIKLANFAARTQIAGRAPPALRDTAPAAANFDSGFS